MRPAEPEAVRRDGCLFPAEETHETGFVTRGLLDECGWLLRCTAGRDGVVTCRPAPHVGIRYSVDLADSYPSTSPLRSLAPRASRRHGRR
ncbi:MAG: hypothetical protein ACRDZ4_05710 [Egibacteraceae bacterium]